MLTCVDDRSDIGVELKHQLRRQVAAPYLGPSRASSDPGAINNTGLCAGVAAQGQEGLQPH